MTWNVDRRVLTRKSKLLVAFQWFFTLGNFQHNANLLALCTSALIKTRGLGRMRSCALLSFLYRFLCTGQYTRAEPFVSTHGSAFAYRYHWNRNALLQVQNPSRLFLESLETKEPWEGKDNETIKKKMNKREGFMGSRKPTPRPRRRSRQRPWRPTGLWCTNTYQLRICALFVCEKS